MAFLCGYEILEEVANGGFSTVYRVQEQEPPYREFAAKKFNDITDHSIFEQEVLSLHAVSGVENTQQFFRAIRHQDQLVILTDYIEGEPLKNRIDRLGPISEKSAINFTFTLCKVIDALHNLGIHHLDIKPSNVLIDQHNTLTLTDFGIAEAADTPRSEITKTDFSYTAPEKYHGYHHAGSDIYALGVSLFYLLTGTLPFNIHATSDAHKMLCHCTHQVNLPDGISSDVHTLLESMLQKSPTKRIGMTELLNQLAQLVAKPLSDTKLKKPNKKVKTTPSEEECFAEAARKNIPFGQYRYALLCEDENTSDALYWYTQAAEAGFARAQNNLALLHMNQGNEEQALHWYLKAASSDNAFSQYNLARLYERKGNKQKAMHWYQQAAQNGHERAQNTVAIKLENDNKQANAFTLYQRAAYSGFKASQFNLGLMYENQVTPNQDINHKDMARFWYGLAAAQDHTKAQQRLKKL